MLAYEFYQRDEQGNSHLIGILPERRKDLLRIDEKAIMNWVTMVLGKKEIEDNIYFVQIEV